MMGCGASVEMKMKPSKPPSTRGRPPTITRDRIADAGIAIGLPNITFVGVAASLGVSHMALYKHVPSLEALKYLIAEVAFSRWQIPRVTGGARPELKDYLERFVESTYQFVKANPGLTPYVLRRSAATQSMLTKIDEHQDHIARAFKLSKAQSRWLLATIAFHCIAVADTVYSVAGREPQLGNDRAAEEAEIEAEFLQGMDTLIIGALTVLERGGAGVPS